MFKVTTLCVSILNFEYIIADWMSTALFCNFSFYAVYMWSFVKLYKSLEEKTTIAYFFNNNINRLTKRRTEMFMNN